MSRIVGVEPTGAPTLTRARAAAPVDAPTGSIAADALNSAIVEAQQILWDERRIVVEPAATVGIAVLRSGAYLPDPKERGHYRCEWALAA